MNAVSVEPLQLVIERHLRTLGYEVCGDEERTGWYWRLGDYDSHRRDSAFDTIVEATADAASDLVDRTVELLADARLVLATWEKGDLAKAIRALAVTVAAMNKGSTEDTIQWPSEEPEEVLSTQGVRLGRQAWLIEGDGSSGAWIDEAHLDIASAILKAREIGQQWIADGIDIDLDALEHALAADLPFTAADSISIRLRRIDLIG